MNDGPELRAPSRRLLGAADWYLRRFFARHFGALRIAADGGPPDLDRPTVLYSNHASWWDPIVLLLVIRRAFPEWRFHGPIDRAALARYPWLERLGLFGIEPGTLQGARRLLETGAALLAREKTGIAMTAQGRFADVRERPIALRRGVTALLERHPEAQAIPVAIEYVFWNERLPEVLLRFGQTGITADGRPGGSLHRTLEQALESELDALGLGARERDPDAFSTLIAGRQGVGAIQDMPQRIRSWLRGESFDPRHSAVGRGPKAVR